MTNFIEPHQDITDVSCREWMHFANMSVKNIIDRWATPVGKGLIERLNNARLSRASLDENIGKFAGKYDLRGIDLSNVNLKKLDLSNIDFFSANFSQSSLSECNLSGSHLSQCDLSGAKFDWAKLDETLLDNVKFNNKTSFLGVDLHSVNFTLATLLYDLSLAQQRIQQLENHHPLFAFMLRISSDYGRSFTRYTAWVLAFLLFYALAYFFLIDKPFIDCLYFSIATFATVGYGDILPVTVLEKLLVMSEIGIGYLMGGLLVGILAKRVIG